MNLFERIATYIYTANMSGYLPDFDDLERSLKINEANLREILDALMNHYLVSWGYDSHGHAGFFIFSTTGFDNVKRKANQILWRIEHGKSGRKIRRND